MINLIRTEYPSVVGGPIVKTPVTIAAGTTLFIRTDSEQIMSDIWEMVTKAFYWDPVEGSVREQWLDDESTKVVVDADLDTVLPAIEKAEYGKFLAREIEFAKEEAENPAVRDRIVKVVRGKDKKVKGATGKVVVVKDMYYGMGYRGSMQPKLGIALDDEKVDVVKNGRTYSSYKNMIWVWAHNCDVVNPAPDAEYAVKTALSRTESYMRSLKSYIERTAKSFGAKNG